MMVTRLIEFSVDGTAGVGGQGVVRGKGALDDVGEVVDGEVGESVLGV